MRLGLTKPTIFFTTLGVAALTLVPTAMGGDNVENQIKQNSDNNSDADSITLRSIDEIARNLEIEITTPSSNEQVHGSYLTISENKLNILTLKLANLEPTVVGQLSDTLRYLPVEVQNWIVIALGLQEDKSVVNKLRNIVSSDRNLFLRIMAIEALAVFRDSANVQLFERALSDTSRVKVYSDTYTEDGINYSFVYPIREAGYRTLRRMNISVTLDSTGNFIIEKPK